MNIEVRTYKNAKEFQKDAQKMLNAGWRMEGQSSGRGPAVGAAAAGALLLGPIGLLAGAMGKGKTTVTWLNDEPAVVLQSKLAKLIAAVKFVVDWYIALLKRVGWLKSDWTPWTPFKRVGWIKPAPPKET